MLLHALPGGGGGVGGRVSGQFGAGTGSEDGRIVTRAQFMAHFPNTQSEN